MKLTEDEVIQILKLIEESRFDELHLEMGDLKLHIRKGGHITGNLGGGVTTVVGQTAVSPKPTTVERKEELQNRAQEPGSMGTIAREERVGRVIEEKVPTTPEEGIMLIKAPMLGTFYRRPSPGDPPYVEVGAFVKEDDTVCLLEVMKVFNSVKAGVRGYIAKICAESGDLVEYGQILFWVKPAETPEETKSNKVKR